MDTDWEVVRKNINYVALNEKLLKVGAYFNGVAFIRVSDNKVVASLQLTDYGWVVNHKEDVSYNKIDKIFISELSKAINKTFGNIAVSDSTPYGSNHTQTKVRKKRQPKVVRPEVQQALKILKELSPLDYDQIASNLGVSSSAVHAWYNNSWKPSETNAKKIIKLYGNVKRS